jgi:hypothetical protein
MGLKSIESSNTADCCQDDDSSASSMRARNFLVDAPPGHSKEKAAYLHPDLRCKSRFLNDLDALEVLPH